MTGSVRYVQNLRRMPKPTIVWDFDGTLLPSDPYDSEQLLLHYLLKFYKNKMPLTERLIGKVALFTDRKQLVPAFFKYVYSRLLTGMPVSIIGTIADALARTISEHDRLVFFKLKEQGFPMMVLSCGTADLSRKVLQKADIDSCFDHIEGNHFRILENTIVGTDVRVPNPKSKITLLTDTYGLTAQEVVAVGDGYTDIPLLDWAGVSILIDRKGTKSVRNDRYLTISSISEILAIMNVGG